MITAVGLATDPTMRHFLATTRQQEAPVTFLDLGEAAAGRWEITLPPDDGSWVLASGGRRLRLDPRGAFYCRLIDISVTNRGLVASWGAFLAAMSAWLELCPGIVINRPGHSNDNASKPLHELTLARRGFQVPASITTSDPTALREFVATGPAVAKPISGQRADCRMVSLHDLDAYDDRSGPVHLQRHVGVSDMRVHVVREQMFALRIDSGGVDYRVESEARFCDTDLPEQLADLIRHTTHELGLQFAGWDFRVEQDSYWALEVNPMPGYSFYDTHHGGAISAALVRALTIPDAGRS